MSKLLVVNFLGKHHELAYQDGESLLETALRADINPPYSCMEGVCCSCEAKLLSGKVDHSEDSILDESELSAGKILTCQSRIDPGCERVEISYDR